MEERAGRAWLPWVIPPLVALCVAAVVCGLLGMMALSRPGTTPAPPGARETAHPEEVTLPSPSPVPSPTPILPSPPPSPTSAPSPTPTLRPTPSPTCPPVSGPFAAVWAQVRDRIGCATGGAIQGLVAEENFEGGKMFWREPIDLAQAVVLFSDGTWRIYRHSPYPGEPEFWCPDANTPPQCPPTPKRGFGMMWCDIPEIRRRLGNATDCERGYQGWMQSFERGFMIQTDAGVTYLFFTDNGTWQRW